MILISQNIWNEAQGRFSSGILEISAGRIRKLEFKTLGKNEARLKANHLGQSFILPSAIDLHVHSRDFSESYKETFASLQDQAFRGGVSVAACMANTMPRLDSELRIRDFLKRVQKLQLKLIPFAAVTQNLEGKVATDWSALLQLPIAGLSDDGKPIMDSAIMTAAAKAVKKANKILSLHEEDTDVSRGSCLHRSESSVRLGVEGSPDDAEAMMVERDLRVAAVTKAHLHFGHLSSAKSVALLRAARKHKISFSAELTPHHGLLTVENAESFATVDLSRFKVCPVIREAKDREALRAGLREGIIDCLASDHAPHSRFEKDRPMEAAAHGMIAMEYHFSLYNELRLQAKLPWNLFIRAWRTRPAELLGLSKQKQWREGGDADVLVVDPMAQVQVSFDRSLSRNSPFQGSRLRGKVIQHMIRGEKVYG